MTQLIIGSRRDRPHFLGDVAGSLVTYADVPVLIVRTR